MEQKDCFSYTSPVARCIFLLFDKKGEMEYTWNTLSKESIMEEFYIMAEVQATLFVYMLAGFYAEKRGIMTPTSRKGMTELLVEVLLPCMVFASFNQEFTSEKLQIGGLVLLVAFALSFLALGLGRVLWRKYPPEKKGVMQYGTLVANSGFAGMAVISSAYGPEGVFLASIFIIPNRIFLWTAGVSFFHEGKTDNVVKTVMTNPGIIAVIVGLTRMVLQVPLPTFLDTSIDAIGSCTAPISMVIIGGILSHVDIKSVFTKDTLLSAAVRLILLPAIALVGLTVLQFPPLEMAVAVILTGMPVASTTAILAEKYGADGKFASQTVFVSTILSLITVPILTFFLPSL